MRYLIIGHGSVGGFIGAMLLENGKDVSFLVKEKSLDAIKENGISVVIDQIVRTFKVNAIKEIKKGEKFDFVFICVRNQDLEQIKPILEMANKSGSKFISLLNGVRHIDYLKQFISVENLLGGAAIMETRIDQNGRIVYLSQEPTIYLGNTFEQNSTIMQELVLSLKKSGFRVKTFKTLDESVWKKYLFNLACNMTAVFGANAEQIKLNKHSMEAVENLINEALNISSLLGVKFEKVELRDIISEFQNLRPGFISILAQDISAGRENESYYLFGYLLEIGSRLNISTPTLTISYALLSLKEKLST
jgi:2-dehydropantoate 2-reductase